MKKIVYLVLLMFVTASYCQDENIGEEIETLTYEWDNESTGLETYDGLSKFCADANYRDEIVSTLKGIHHFDSMLYLVIQKKVRFGGDAEMKNTLKDIEKLQNQFSISEFLSFLSDECRARKEIENNMKKYGEDVDGDVYMLEVELQKYIKKVTKQVDMIRKHVHHLGVK